MLNGLSFDDVLLVPQVGVLNSRRDANISTWLTPSVVLDIPIVSANMKTVTGTRLAREMARLGGIGFLRRDIEIDQAAAEFEPLARDGISCVPCVGLEDFERHEAFAAANPVAICLDVAHGDHVRVLSHLSKVNLENLVVGNIATYDAAMRLIDAGVRTLKVGIGPGAACTTREVTGFGVPQLTAIMEVKRAIHRSELFVTLIADGGIKTSGDIVKALAAGADTVMIGRMFAGTTDAALPGFYAGSASEFARPGYRAPEGVHGDVEIEGSAEDLVKRLCWGIKSGLSYGGAETLQDLRKNAVWTTVTPQGVLESQARL